MKLFLILIALTFYTQTAHANILDIQEITSKKGIKAWLVEDSSVPVISVHFSFKGSGTKNDTKETQGLIRLLSNTLDEGSGEYSSQEFQKILNDNSISLGFGASRDDFNGHLKTLTKNKNLAFQLLETALSEPRFDEEPVNRMIDANLSRIRQSMTNPQWIAARLMNDAVYGTHPYALNSGGTLSTLPKISAQQLKEAHKELILKNRLIVAVSGDITAKELSSLLDRTFADLPDKTDAETKTDRPRNASVQNKNTVNIFNIDVPQSVVQIALPGISRNDPNFYAAQVLNHIFGAGGFGSRLTKEIREKRGLTYGIYAYFSQMDESKLYTISSSTQTKSVAELLDVIEQEMIRIKDHPVTNQELQEAKEYITGSLPISFTSNDSVAAALLEMQQEKLPADYLETYISRIKKITSNDILRVAQRLLNPENTVTVIVGDIHSDSLKSDKIYDTLPNTN